MHYVTANHLGGWSDLGGEWTLAPGAATWGPNRADVFATGTDRALYHKWWDGRTWSEWQKVGGEATTAADAARTGQDSIELFVVGTNKAVDCEAHSPLAPDDHRGGDLPFGGGHLPLSIPVCAAWLEDHGGLDPAWLLIEA